MTVAEGLVGGLLPWLGGFTGATLLYFFMVIALNLGQSRRLRKIEQEVGTLHELVLVLLNDRRRER